MDHLLGVGVGELLYVGAPVLRKLVGQPVDVGRRVGLLLDRLAGRLILLPHGDHHERQEHGVDHAQRRVDEARHVVVLLARGGGHQAMHELETREREESDPPDHQNAIDYRVQHAEDSPP